MAVFGTLNLAVMIAVVACCIGGAFGGLRLAQPRALKARSRAEERALAGALILSHAGSAMALGYAPSVGGLMAAVLALGWLGAGLGRAASLVLDRAKDPMLRQGLVLELLMAVCLALPWMNIGGLSLAPSIQI
jgi:hypothetical protein